MSTTTVQLRGVSPAAWQARLLAAFADMPEGGSVRLASDHDPIEVWRWLEGLQPGRFTWEYIGCGTGWQVEVGLPFRSTADCLCRRAS